MQRPGNILLNPEPKDIRLPLARGRTACMRWMTANGETGAPEIRLYPAPAGTIKQPMNYTTINSQGGDYRFKRL